jgi:peptidoglycan/LPS O-acetylase OafA/YrhL
MSTATDSLRRLTWLDANRFYAALGIILIHSSSDFEGRPFAQWPVADRIAPGLIRAVAEVASSEMFLTFAFFLLALKIDRREPHYGRTVADQAQRLVVPLIVWTVFYAFFRLIKASVLGYEDVIWAELSQARSWLAYLFLGTAQYHLHFLPTMFALVLFYPAMRVAARWPLLGFTILPALFFMDSVQHWLWAHTPDPLTRDYLIRGVKILGYVGYGVAAFALYGLWKRDLAQEDGRRLFAFLTVLTVLLFCAKAVYVADSIVAGEWLPRMGAQMYAHLLLPVVVFGLFFAAQGSSWPPRYSHWARLSYGAYLIHPAYIDLVHLGLLQRGIEMHPLFVVALTYAVVAPLTFGTAYLLSRIRALAWIIGLGPVPGLSSAHPHSPREG